MKNDLILVYYIDVREIDTPDIRMYVNGISDKLLDADIYKQYFLPVKFDSKIECINPRVMKQDEYADVINRLDNAKKDYQTFMEDMLKDIIR